MEIFHEQNNIAVCCHIMTFQPVFHSLHWHENYEICQILDHSCKFRIDGELIEASAGDLVAIREQSVHRFIIDAEDTHIRIFQFPIKYLLYSSLEHKTLKPHIRLEEIRNIPELEQKLSMLFRLMELETPIKTNEENLFQQNLTVSLYFLLLRYFEDENVRGSNKKSQQDFYRILEYINNHYQENITASSIAEALFMTRGKISATFTSYADMSLNTYIIQLRLCKANQLLESGYNITEAALESGFQNIRTFNMTYKKLTGITPTEYINRRK